MHKQDEEIIRKLENLGNYLRQGLKWRRTLSAKGEGSTSKRSLGEIVSDVVREQFPKDREMLLKEMAEKSKGAPKPDFRTTPKPKEQRRGKKH